VKKIILINGIKRSGKDYLGELMQELIPHSEIHKFADPIKEIIAVTFGISLDDLEVYKNNSQDYGIEIKVYPNNQPDCTLKYVNFREILQKFGTEAMKPVFGNDVWAELCLKRALEAEISIITDFRFYDEWKVVNSKDVKIFTINIFNDSLPQPDNHASERDLEDNNFKFDFYIDNTNQPNIFEDVKNIIKNILD